jgi:class 3 adenylate cyclase/alpha-beta hydrolase superfamily lysophospholipase
MEQQIGFCTASDGVRIAYATLGEGPPLVYVSGWPTHLEMEWGRPTSRTFLNELAHGITLIRYDMRGGGLSDHNVEDFSIDALVKDLQAVVEHLGLVRVPLLTLGSLAGPVAMKFAANHPERVSALFICSGFLRGPEITTPDRVEATLAYVEKFGLPVFEYAFEPGVDPQAQRDIHDTSRAACKPHVQADMLRTLYTADVTELADRLEVPITVMHGRGDRLIPFRLGRELAARTHARFLPVEGNTGVAWTQRHVVLPEIRRFFGVTAPADEQSRAGLLTILFTDITDSTALTQRLGDAAAQELVRSHNAIVRDALGPYGGTEIKHTGDGIMASFPSASGALDCAVAIQRGVEAYGRGELGLEGRPSAALAVHVGLNAGEPVAEESDLFGTAVQLARRICDQAQADEILVSNVVRELAAGKNFLFSDRGEVVPKGFDEAVRLYELRWRDELPAS